MEKFEDKAKEVLVWLEGEYAGIRSGQASPAILDGVRVLSYGAKVPLNQVGTLGIEDARTLRLTLWDKEQQSAVETAIREAELGLSVVSDSSGLRVVFPELTSERRQQLTKLARNKLEEARISLRALRDEANKEIEHKQREGGMTEDDKFRAKDRLQKTVDETNQMLSRLCERKEKELNA